MTISALLLAPAATAMARSRTATASTTTSTSTNLLTGDTASLSGSVGSWTAENGTVTRPASGVLATTTSTDGWSLTLSGTKTAAAADRVYRGSFTVRTAMTSRQVVPYLYFYGSGGAVLDKVKGEVAQDTATGWSAVTQVVAIAPKGAVAVALGSLTWGSVAGEVHYLSQPVLTTATPKRTDVVGPLHTSGNQVLDANGPIRLRGIHRVALEGGMGSTTGVNLTAEDLGQAKRWGANMVRLSVSSAYWLATNCQYDAGYADAVDQAVQQVTSRGMVALIDLHTNSLTACGKVSQQPMADTTALDFWSAVARRYRGNLLVAFDLYNEPHDISDAVWLHGGAATAGGVVFQAVGMQSMYDAVRAAGADNLVFASGNNWANTLPADRLQGSDIVYGVHAYTCPVQVDSSCLPSPLDPSSILGSWVTPSSEVPVVVTEFGWPTTASGTYVANVIRYAETHGWGWVAFAWDGTTYGKFSLLSTAGAGASYQPTPSGMPVLSAFAAA